MAKLLLTSLKLKTRGDDERRDCCQKYLLYVLKTPNSPCSQEGFVR